MGKAHYHATWEDWSSLASSCKGIKKLDNYFRKAVLEETYLLNDPDLPPEDREKFLLDREKEADAMLDYQHVEKVIGSREGDNGLEYLVKCEI